MPWYATTPHGMKIFISLLDRKHSCSSQPSPQGRRSPIFTSPCGAAPVHPVLHGIRTSMYSKGRASARVRRLRGNCRFPLIPTFSPGRRSPNHHLSLVERSRVRAGAELLAATPRLPSSQPSPQGRRSPIFTSPCGAAPVHPVLHGIRTSMYSRGRASARVRSFSRQCRFSRHPSSP